jgi:hypothetical protein
MAPTLADESRVHPAPPKNTTRPTSTAVGQNLLQAAGVKRVVMAALGEFGFVYNYETFAITGSPFAPTYTWQSVSRQEMYVRGEMQIQALREFSRLKDMVMLRQLGDMDVEEKKMD